jgi:DNA-binding transcriptional ArsR family regulator
LRKVITEQIDATVEECDVIPELLKAALNEIQELLHAFVSRAYERLADIDRRLTGKGYPKSVTPKPVKGLIQSMQNMVNNYVQAALDLAELKKSGQPVREAMKVVENRQAPTVFLSHSSLDKELVSRLANDLMAAGIAAWYAEWEIKPGDSLRRKVDEGIETASHFLVILTANSLRSEWVQTELDAAMIKRIAGKCRLIPVLHEIGDNEVPITLSGIRWVMLNPYEKGLQELVKGIHGLSEKPVLGLAPAQGANPQSLGLSSSALQLATLLSERSQTGLPLDPMLSASEVLSELNLTPDQISIAAAELEEHGFVKLHLAAGQGNIGFYRISPTARFFIKTDLHLRGWHPNHDARELTATILKQSKEGLSMVEADRVLGWGSRRINPAAYYLHENGRATCLGSLGTHPYAFSHILVTPKTKRFAEQGD